MGKWNRNKVSKNGYGMSSYHYSSLFLFHLTYHFLVGLQGLWTTSPIFSTYLYSLLWHRITDTKEKKFAAP